MRKLRGTRRSFTETGYLGKGGRATRAPVVLGYVTPMRSQFPSSLPSAPTSPQPSSLHQEKEAAWEAERKKGSPNLDAKFIYAYVLCMSASERHKTLGIRLMNGEGGGREGGKEVEVCERSRIELECRDIIPMALVEEFGREGATNLLSHP